MAADRKIERSFLHVFFPFFLNFIAARCLLQTDLLFISRLGVDALAAFAIPMRIMIIDALIAFATAPFVSVALSKASSDEDRKQLVASSLAFGVCAGVVAAAFGTLIYPAIIDVLWNAPNITGLAKSATFWLTVATPIRLAQFIATMALHGLGKGRLVITLSLGEIVLNALLDWYLILHAGYGFEGAYIATIVSTAVNLVASVIILDRFAPFFDRLCLPTRDFLARLYESSGPELGRLLSERGVAIVALWLVAQGSSGSVRLPAFALATELQYFLSIPCLAAMRATAVFGQRDEKTFRVGLATLAGLAAVWLACGDRIGRHIYLLPDAEMYWWRPFIAVFALMLPLRWWLALRRGTIQSQGQMACLLRIDWRAKWGCFLPLFLTAIWLDSPWLLWTAFLAEDVTCALLLIEPLRSYPVASLSRA